MSVKVLTIPHLTDDLREREEFFCPLLAEAGVAHYLRVEVAGKRTLRLAGLTSSRQKLWEATVELKEVL